MLSVGVFRRLFDYAQQVKRPRTNIFDTGAAATISVGQVTETDLAQAIVVAGAIAIAVGQVTEVDVAQAISAIPGAASVSVAQVTEVDLAQGIVVEGGGVSVKKYEFTAFSNKDVVGAAQFKDKAFSASVSSTKFVVGALEEVD